MQFRKTFMNICSIHFYVIIQRVINIRLIQSIEHNFRVYSLKINKTSNESFLFSFSITIPDLSGVLAKHCKFNRSLLEHFRLPLVFYVVDLRAWEQLFSNTMGCAMRICSNFSRHPSSKGILSTSNLQTELHVYMYDSLTAFKTFTRFGASMPGLPSSADPKSAKTKISCFDSKWLAFKVAEITPATLSLYPSGPVDILLVF